MIAVINAGLLDLVESIRGAIVVNILLGISAVAGCLRFKEQTFGKMNIKSSINPDSNNCPRSSDNTCYYSTDA